MFGCTVNQSSPDRDFNGMKVEQNDKPKNLAPGVDGVGSGTSPLGSHSANHKALCVKLRPEIEQPSCHTFGSDANSLGSVMDNQEVRLSAVGMSEACLVAPIRVVCLAEGDHSLPSQDPAFDEQMAPASGTSSEVEELSSVRDLTVMAQEVTCVASGENSSSRLGLISQSPLMMQVTATVPSDVCFDASSIGMPNEVELAGSTHSSHAAPNDQHGKDPDRAQIVLGNPMFDLVQIDGLKKSDPRMWSA
ncbi:hypothetical protein Nepgr_006818 [Nepenthes gracilis]|uniref:Uncharacterized protein n=1 Tax=Nepenthes gracilis TaxID=150966 RepID=A0AAD3XHQ4_NEPGR|nr:hypothetical protein Nepgr_006818 [Nepenthes gracilis]